jgi:TolB-like protein
VKPFFAMAFFLAAATHIAHASDNKPLVAVAPLSARSVDSGSIQVIEDAIASELVKTKKVRVLERAQMSRILAEQGFQQTACDQNNCSVEMGRLLAVNSMLTGSLGRIGNTYSLSLRMVDVETGEVTGSITTSKSGDIDAVLTDLLPSAVRQLVSPDATTGHRPGTQPAPAKKKGTSVVYWTVGGVVLVGAGVAAALLLMGDEGSSSEPPPAQNNQSDKTNVEVTLP